MNVDQDPFKLPAAILALAVHLAFFALLYFGFSWHTSPAVIASVELWKSLPDTAPVVIEHKVAAPAPPAPPEKEAAQPSVEEVIKPDIVIPVKKPKKKPEIKPEKNPEKAPEKKPEKQLQVREKTPEKPLQKTAKEVNVIQEKKLDVTKLLGALKSPVQTAQPVVSAADQQVAHDKITQEASSGKTVDEFVEKIRSKIRNNIVPPPDVADNAQAVFLVTVLPGGNVLPPRLLKSSGNTMYDTAVERAILRSDPLPLPADAGLFSRFRELRLSFKPVKLKDN